MLQRGSFCLPVAPLLSETQKKKISEEKNMTYLGLLSASYAVVLLLTRGANLSALNFFLASASSEVATGSPNLIWKATKWNMFEHSSLIY